jgi:hypothetical protein
VIYCEFINNILNTRGRFNCNDEYHERHHIIPKCMGGTDDKENLIDLLAREHFVAHRLLAIENPENEKLAYALWCMCSLPGSSKKRAEVTSEEYEEARKQYAQKFSGGKNPSARRVIRLCDQKIYDTIRSCCADNNTNTTTMHDMLKQYRNFMYYDEWIILSEHEQDRIRSIDWDLIQHINRSEAAKRAGNGGSVKCSQSTREKIGIANKKHGISVYCPELNEYFITMKAASDKYGINKESIRLCIHGKQKHAGKHPVTGELLSWVKLENKNS